MITMGKWLVGVVIVIGVVSGTTRGYAQSAATVGSLRGTLRDSGTSEAVTGATIVATSPALQGDQVALTDESGEYYITALPPGIYTLTVFWADTQFSRSNVLVQIGKDV